MRAIANRFLAGPLLQLPFLQAFWRIAINSVIEFAPLLGAGGLLLLGCCPVI
jgi:hypothetical protein